MACTEDVLDVMDRGQRNRAVAETRMNDRSSRSHQASVGVGWWGVGRLEQGLAMRSLVMMGMQGPLLLLN